MGEKEDARDSIEYVDKAIQNISGQRASLGALQSRLKSTVQNLETQSINTDEARSVIQDSDIAGSAAKLASKNIIKNAAISTLSQANNMPNAALRLIP